MVIRLSSAGIRLAGFWLFLGGTLLGGVFFWFSPFMGILAWVLAFLFFLCGQPVCAQTGDAYIVAEKTSTLHPRATEQAQNASTQ